MYARIDIVPMTNRLRGERSSQLIIVATLDRGSFACGFKAHAQQNDKNYCDNANSNKIDDIGTNHFNDSERRKWY